MLILVLGAGRGGGEGLNPEPFPHKYVAEHKTPEDDSSNTRSFLDGLDISTKVVRIPNEDCRSYRTFGGNRAKSCEIYRIDRYVVLVRVSHK